MADMNDSNDNTIMQFVPIRNTHTANIGDISGHHTLSHDSLSRTATTPDEHIARSRTHDSFARTHTRESQKETYRDPALDVNLPYRTLTAEANLDEYTVESPTGVIAGPVEPDGKERYKLVTFTPDDPGNPKNWSKAYKWYCTMVVAVTCFVVAFASSVITADLAGVSETFHVSREVSFLTITVFVAGFGVGKQLDFRSILSSGIF